MSSSETFGVNTDLVKRVKDRGSSCAVVEFIDGTQMVIMGGLQWWLAQIGQQQDELRVRNA